MDCDDWAVRSPIIIVRPATPADLGVIIDMIRALAEYENLSEQCAAEAGPLREHLGRRVRSARTWQIPMLQNS